MEWVAFAVFSLVMGVFMVFVVIRAVQSASNPFRYGSASGGLMEGRIMYTYGEFPTRPMDPVQQVLRVLAVQTDTQPAVGLELAGSGPMFQSLMPIRLTPEEAVQVASWLDCAASGAPGGAPEGGWFGYEFLSRLAPVSGYFGTIEMSVRARHYKLHIVRAAHPTHPVGVGFRGTVRWASSQIVAALVEPRVAHALAACLRHAASEATSRRDAVAA
ncbi:MAG: hypothetical protein KIT72_02900 [Polyangiaceae bacterium]|nr:hypothetical protein [Polyangiaceae bacterium]MCW5789348.1 hypothetical protein [Polyangiaceae bacterium]